MSTGIADGKNAHLVLVSACLALLSACGQPRADKPNVLILLMDTLRADRLGCYGYGRPTSPVVDDLANGGVVFTRCYAPSDYTQASTASLFTGQDPLVHGYMNSNYVLEEANVTMAELFRDNGYQTAAFIANGLAGEKYGMDQGFDRHVEQNRAPAPELATAARAFLDEHAASSEKPFFIYMHFLDVHDPHRIPHDQFGRFADPGAFAVDMQDSLLLETFVMRAWWSKVQKWKNASHSDDVVTYFADYADLYDASIAYWDQAVGTILESLDANGLTDDTIIIVTSDHGEQLLEHGFFGHANSGYDVGLHVPLIINDPQSGGDWGGRRIHDPVSLIDVLPALLERVEVPVPSHLDGHSLWPHRDTERPAAADAKPIYSEGTFFTNRPVSTLIQSYRDGDWKLILDRFRDTKELYNLSRDPGEEQNLIESEADIARRLYTGLQRRYNKNLHVFDSRDRSRIDQVDEKLKELQSLGYVSSAVPTPSQRPVQYHPMKGAEFTRFGPFGDEEDLHHFSDHLDFSGRDPVAFGQIVRGCREDPRLAHSTGVWFDRRSTFLMHNDGAKRRVVFEVRIEQEQPVHPTQVQVEFNDIPGEVSPIDGFGNHRLAYLLPDALQTPGYFHTGLLVDGRFVLREGASPRTHKYGAIKIRSVTLE